MQIVWDEPKRQRNIEIHHGLDFADVEHGFDFENALYGQANPSRDGRPRYKAIGHLDDVLVTLVFAQLGSEAISLISLRRSSRKERRAYDEAKPGNH